MAEKKGYSLSRALAETLTKGGPVSGLAAELHFETLRARESSSDLVALISAQTAGGCRVALPLTRQISAGGSPGLVGTETIIASDLLQWSACVQAGATVLEGLQNNVALAFTSKNAVTGWRPELGATIETDPEFKAVALGPAKRVTGMIVVSRQMLAQVTSPALDQFLLAELGKSASSQLDRFALYGPMGLADAPTGIKGTAGHHQIDIGADEPWPDLTEAERLVELEDVAGEIAYIVSPDTKKVLRDRERWVGSGSNPWEHINGFSSNQVSTAEIFFGIFPNQMMIGIWGSDIIVNPFSRGSSALVELVLNLFCSVAIRRPGCFGIANIALPPLQDSRRAQPAKPGLEPVPGAPVTSQESVITSPSSEMPANQARKGQKGWQR